MTVHAVLLSTECRSAQLGPSGQRRAWKGRWDQTISNLTGHVIGEVESTERHDCLNVGV